MKALSLEAADLTASPLQIPIALSTLRNHCAVDPGTELEELAIDYFWGAIEWAEGETHRAIVSRAHTWVLEDFPRTVDQRIRLPRGKTQSVQSIVYSLGGVLTTLTGPDASPVGSDFQQDLRGNHGGVLMPPRGETWPDVDDDVPAPVVISFTAGWTSAQIPKDMVRALLFATKDALENPGGDLRNDGRNLSARQALLSQFIIYRF